MLHPYPIRYLEGKELNFYQLLPLRIHSISDE